MTAIEKLIHRFKSGKASVFDVKALKTFSDMTPAEYESVRAKLKSAGVERLPELDNEVKKLRKESAPKDIEPDANQQILAIANEFDFFTDDNGTAYANLPDRFVTVQSKAFRDLLTRSYIKKTGNVVSKTTLDNVTAAVNALAYESPKRRVFIRVAPLAKETYVDMCDDSGEYVHITARGWQFIKHADLPKSIAFKRAKTMRPLPRPVTGGSIAELRPFLNIQPDFEGVPSPDDTNFVLAVMWLANCYREGAFPVLAFAGEYGGGKSTNCNTLRILTDPAKPLSQSMPKDLSDLAVTAEKQHVLSFDNVSFIADWLSDGLCRIATGSGLRKRELYTDGDEVAFDAKRPIILNGINSVIVRPDLLDRALILPLAPIANYMTDTEFEARLSKAAPRILGALFDIIADGLKKLPQTKTDSATPRMAAFETFGRAAEGLVCEPGAFRKAYRENRLGSKAALLESNIVAQAIVEYTGYLLSENFQDEWNGTAGELLKALENPDAFSPAPTYDPDELPKDSTRLSRKLRPIVPDLRTVHGINIDFERRGKGRGRIREIQIQRHTES